MNDLARIISRSGVNKIKDLWLADWDLGRRKHEHGEAERWFHVVLDFLSIRGDEIHARSLIEQQERVIDLGRSKEYLAALAEVVEKSPKHSEYDHTLLVVIASPEERSEALRKVLGI